MKNELGKDEYLNIALNYEYNINNVIEKPTDIVRLVILKYAYHLRCKRFHAEKLPTNFLINNRNLSELEHVVYPLSVEYTGVRNFPQVAGM
ncbi:MAG: hypothetical protein ACOX6Y_03540 [Christensenellales bacterium]|jgi:hypothetical protein